MFNLRNQLKPSPSNTNYQIYKVIRIPLVCLLIILASWSLHGQTLHYDVVRNGSSMGSTVVKRTASGEQLKYSLNTKTEFRVIFLLEVEYNLEETFQNGTLTSGSGFNTLNGSTQKETKMKRTGSSYELIIDGIRTVVNEPGITESVSEVYFEEPYDGKDVYSAYFARYLTFVKTGEHKYSLASPDGTNVYTYENGICTNVVVSRDFATFSQVLLPEMLADVRQKKITGSAYD